MIRTHQGKRIGFVSFVVLAVLVISCAPATTPTSTPTTAVPTEVATSPVVPSPLPVTTPVATPTIMAIKSAEDLQRITPEELMALLESGADIVVVDNQPKAAYDIGHVPGARNLPWDATLKSAAGLPKDKLLVLYCACQNEEDAIDVGMQLVNKFGYTKIMLLEGGWLKWTELGLPVETAEGA